MYMYIYMYMYVYVYICIHIYLYIYIYIYIRHNSCINSKSFIWSYNLLLDNTHSFCIFNYSKYAYLTVSVVVPV